MLSLFQQDILIFSSGFPCKNIEISTLFSWIVASRKRIQIVWDLAVNRLLVVRKFLTPSKIQNESNESDLT